MFYGQVTWERFMVGQNDASGVRNKFENLSRQLFKDRFISNNENIKVLLRMPNHPGLEAEPIYSEITGKNVGFQAKFFDKDVDYDQIKKSVDRIIKYYAGKVDLVYLFCNKDLTITSKIYKEIVELLASNDMSLVPVTNEEILDLVRKCPVLAKYYFDEHGITLDWVNNHNNRMLDTLGVRFNRNFNVNTDSSLQLSLFVCDSEAISYINSKKDELIEKIDSLGWKYKKYNSYLNELKKLVLSIEDINYDDIKEECVKEFL